MMFFEVNLEKFLFSIKISIIFSNIQVNINKNLVYLLLK